MLPALGPDLGLCLLAPADADKGPLPHGLFAVRVRAEKGADEAMLSAVDFYARLAMVAYRNQGKAMGLKSLRQDRTEVKYLDGEGVFPPGVQPAYALKDGYLVLASSPEALPGASARLRRARSPAKCRSCGYRRGGCTNIWPGATQRAEYRWRPRSTGCRRTRRGGVSTGWWPGCGCWTASRSASRRRRERCRWRSA